MDKYRIDVDDKIKGKNDMLLSVKENLIRYIKNRDDEKLVNDIIDAMNIIDRRFFIKHRGVYVDTALHIGHNQTISQPSTVAIMLLFSKIKKGNNILELGTGSGWNAAITGFLSYPGKLLSTDIIPELIKNAKSNVKNIKSRLNQATKKKLENIEFKKINILKNPDQLNQKFDKIIITAGIKEEQKKLILELANSALKEDGELICPYTQGPLILIKKRNQKIITDYTKEQFVFVPLIS